MNEFNRRDLFVKGGAFLISTSALFNLASLDLSNLSLLKQSTSNNHIRNIKIHKKIGKVTSILGEAYIENIPLKVGKYIPAGFTISVKNNSRVIIVLPDKSIITLNSCTDFDLRSVFDNKIFFQKLKKTCPAILSENINKKYEVSQNKLSIIYEKKDLTFSLNIKV